MHNKENEIEVVFSLPSRTAKLNQVVISPVEDKWNDFGHRIRCSYDYLPRENGDNLVGDAFIGFLAPKNATESEKIEFYEKYRSLESIFENHKEKLLKASKLPDFFTLLPDLNGYRAVVRALGLIEAKRLLKSINDLVVSKSLNTDWIEDALKTESFKLGFMRNSEPYYAFQNAYSILNGSEEESFSKISKSLNLKFKLEGFENPHEIKFRFDNKGLIPRRINVLIGKNGLGKSQALKHFSKAALQREDSGTTLIDIADKNRRPMINRVLAIATPGETANTFPSEYAKSQKLYYRRLNLTRGGKSKDSRSMGETLVDLARKEEFIGNKSRWELFVESLRKALPIESLAIPLEKERFVLLNKFNNGGAKEKLERWSAVEKGKEPRLKVGDDYYPLSSGQLTFFKFTLLCCVYIENGSLVLMDEPETHLHPNLISDFVNLLDFILENTGSQAILATHSAYFVREIPKEQVHVFQMHSENTISIENPRLNTFGATVDSISQFVFLEDSEVELTEKIISKIGNRIFEDIEEELSKHISLAALMNIRRRIEKI
jgi:energy-coupling factor transporter ATP-binding protein EcfA2